MTKETKSELTELLLGWQIPVPNDDEESSRLKIDEIFDKENDRIFQG